MYIHRVGRTARYTARGKALLLLLPGESEPFQRLLTRARVPPLKRLKVNPKMRISIAQKAAALNASRPGPSVRPSVRPSRSLSLDPSLIQFS